MGKKMKVDRFEFGSIVINGKEYTSDLVIEGREIKKRKKKNSKPYRSQYGHTPLSAKENIPWDCKRLVIGMGCSEMLPVMDDVKKKAEKRGVELLQLKTDEALQHLNEKGTNLILHLTC